MSKEIYAKHPPYNNGHLGEVVRDMELEGSPTIRAVEYKGELFATEGSHRLAAAHHLKVVPKIVIEEEIKDDGLNFFWDQVKKRLPRYCFDNLLVLDLRRFNE
jgi:hypothetical protein